VRTLGTIPRDPTEPGRPFVVRAEVSNHHYLSRDHDAFTTASGKGMTLAAAEASALGEALERYGSAPWEPARIVSARREELELPAVAPPELVLYADEQYGEVSYDRWDEASAIGWVQGRRLHDGERVYVPALGTFLDYAPAGAGEFLCQVTSNGLAAGPSLGAAVLSGLYEVLERDAFMLGWIRRLEGRRVAPEASGDPELQALALAYRRRGVDLRLVLLEVDHPVAVCAAFGVDEGASPDRPAVVVGLGADLDWGVAVRKAALEVGQVRPALRARLRAPDTRDRLAELLEDPMRVSELEDHDLLYADPSQLPQLEHWLASPEHDPGPRAEAATDPAVALERVVTSLAAAGTPVVFVNLTPADIGGLGISVVRVHAPGLQPIHFGARESRLGGDRVWDYGAPAGTRAARSMDRLNLQPHPLA